ncbi:MAG: arginine deiminase-related protein [Microscillaceae bacterium]|nr:arginine deiminase-related protein [Microscillaceae bacterium]MDW8460895.1 arginine deiminase-related protein [Cytophagales bacterium]
MQTTSHLLMIRPVRFTFNTQTAESNAFQQAPNIQSAIETQAKALQEFDNLVATLRKVGVEVMVVEDTPEPHTPDSIFPNNWISTHADGTIFLYPMEAPNRRLERRQDILDLLAQKFHVSQIIDFSDYETQNRFLEGTGSMVLDRTYGIVYAALSTRTDLQLAQEFAQKVGYELITFHALDKNNKPIYHTNVVMCLANNFAVICLECIKNEQEREQVITKLTQTGKEIVAISMEQLEQFAGNMLALSAIPKPILAMSSRAYHSLRQEQIQILEKYAQIVHSDISTIETNGGGSVRCMLAEIFLPPLN